MLSRLRVAAWLGGLAVLAAVAIAVGLFSSEGPGTEPERAGTPGAAREAGSPGAAPPSGELPPALARNARQGDQLVGEGGEAFRKRLAELRGHPVVVNQWASWCTSCRFEFPFFREAVDRFGDRVAFLGLDSEDERGAAEEFLEEFPVGFPSIFDPDASVAASIGGARSWPTTFFFDERGEQVHTKIGAYATPELLEEDIRRHALGGEA